MDQRGAVLRSLLSAAGVTGAGGLPAPAAPVTSAAPVACSSAVPASGASTPAGGPVRVRSVAGVGPLPLLALPVRPVCLSPLPLSPRNQRRGLV